MSDFSAAYNRMKRTCRTATSWFERASAIARATELPQVDPDFSLVGYEVGYMLDRILGQAESLVPLILDMHAEDIEQHAKNLAAALRRRRLAGAMENTSGRTEAEKELFDRARERLTA